uniref:Uncharacterized protein n=1 Tax=Oryza meridionalis TaxID=40149 RepID=A0A0E0D4D0_9ORYZ
MRTGSPGRPLLSPRPVTGRGLAAPRVAAGGDRARKVLDGLRDQTDSDTDDSSTTCTVLYFLEVSGLDMSPDRLRSIWRMPSATRTAGLDLNILQNAMCALTASSTPGD